MRNLMLLLLVMLTAKLVDAQLISVYPYFPKVTDSITIIYDATQGNAALVGVSPVYAHTGLITTQSTNNGDWKKTQGNWGTADNHVLMTSLGNNKFSISYNITSYYGVAATDTVKDLAFVFRNVDGSKVGRNADASNIILPLYNDSLHAGFITPNNQTRVVPLNSSLSLKCGASKNSALTLSVNGNTLSQVQGTTLTQSNYTFTTYGQYKFVFTAVYNGHTATDSLLVFVNPANTVQDPPANVVDGINYIDDSTVILSLFAPYKNFSYVIGDFNNWQIDTAYLMRKSIDGTRYWLKVNHLTPQKEYIFQYFVDGTIRIGDPYADKISDPDADLSLTTNIYPVILRYPYGKTAGIASVLQTAQKPYVFQNTNFHRPDKHNLVVYELLIRDFITYHNWARLVDTLGYLQRLGVNAIELMPIMNYEGTNSWGYNPNYYFAPEKAYGPKDSLKMFIDTCHNRGIAVLLDIALNDAFGSCPLVMLYWDSINNQPAANNPWFNQQPTHPFSVGYDFNHESIYTKKFVDRVNRYWLREYHTDGYRFDLTKGYTQTYSGNDVGLWQQYDASRVAILERMVDSIWAFDATAINIFEHLSDNPEQTELSNHGILLWGNMNAQYNQISMGYQSNSDVSQVSYQARGWSNANLVGYMESHDEERLMYKNLQYGNVNGAYSAKVLETALKRMEMTGNMFFPVPGPKMIWQFGEVGYGVSINQGCRICNKPIMWYYDTIPARLHLFKVWSAFIHLKTTYAPFSTNNYSVDMGGLVKSIKLNHSQFNVVAVSNMDVATQSYSPNFQHTGWWYDYFTGDSMNVTNTGQSYSYQAGEYHLYTDKSLPTPDLSTTVATDVAEVNLSNAANTTFAYPNPTNGVINFVFQLAQKGDVQVAIMDLNGRAIYTDKQTSLPGLQTISVDLSANGNTLSNGLYIYRIVANGEVFNGKINYFNK